MFGFVWSLQSGLSLRVFYVEKEASLLYNLKLNIFFSIVSVCSQVFDFWSSSLERNVLKQHLGM